MKYEVFTVDSFTTEIFKGNPAGVCIVRESMSEAIMQRMASELNLSETAFVQQVSETSFSIRYFTPSVEIDFCGHATLAASKVVSQIWGIQDMVFITHHNLTIPVQCDGENSIMTFPLHNLVEYTPTQELYDAFGIKNPLSTRISQQSAMILIEVFDTETLLRITPNFSKALLVSDTVQLLIVTSRSRDAEYDFYSRCFCPWIGIDEDPVTGSSHCALSRYWSEVLQKQELSAYQLSKRGGSMKIKIINPQEIQISGAAKIVFVGTIEI